MTQESTLLNLEELEADLKFTHSNLSEAMMTQPALYAKWAVSSMKVTRLRDRLKQQLELLEAKLDEEIRVQLASEGAKVTETLVANRIKQHDDYQALMTRYLSAKSLASMSDDCKEAFRQRRDMLVQIGKDLREERLGELRVTGPAADIESMKDQVLRRAAGG